MKQLLYNILIRWICARTGGNVDIHGSLVPRVSSQEVPHILWNQKVHYCIRMCPPVHILSQVSPVHASPSNFMKIHFNIILLRPLPSYKNTYFYSHLPTHCRCRGLLLHLSTQAVIYMLCMTPLEEGSARRRGLYLCNTRHSQETNIHSAAEIRTRNPSERPPCLILLHYVLINRMGYTERGGRVRELPCLSNFHQN